jgi:hypothetical protein
MKIDESDPHCENAHFRMHDSGGPGWNMTVEREPRPFKHDCERRPREVGSQTDESDEQCEKRPSADALKSRVRFERDCQKIDIRRRNGDTGSLLTQECRFLTVTSNWQTQRCQYAKVSNETAKTTFGRLFD